MNFVLPFLSSVVMLVFVLAVLRRWLSRRGPHLLVWAIGLSMFGIASFAEVYATVSWNSPLFYSWYLFGAMLNAAWIGQGTVYFLARRWVAHASVLVLIVLSLIGTYGVITLTLDSEIFTTDLTLADQYKDIMPSGAWARAMTPLFNIYGLLTLVGGAIYSSWVFWRRRIAPNRMWGNILIAVGALAISSASTLTRLGYGELLYLGELVAAAHMFAGFILATRRPVRPAPRPVPSGTDAVENQ